MLRLFISIALVFLLSSCSSSPKTHKTGIISGQEIISQQLDLINISKEKYNIALIVPLSKEKEHIGSSVVKAAQLAIENSKNPNINLILLNSDLITNNPDLLLSILQEKQIKVIIGPIYTKETEQLNSLLAKENITILSLSNDSSIKGKSLLLMGLTPEAQTTALTNYAIGQAINNFHLIIPSNKYGKLINNDLASIVSLKNDINYQVSWYNAENINNVIDNLVNSISQSTHDTENQAIFMPLAGNNLITLNTSLAKHKLKINLIGSKAWDTPNSLALPELNGAILIKNDIKEQKFSEDYEQAFKTSSINLIDAITYNAISMIIHMHTNDLTINKNTIIENNPDRFNENSTAIYDLSIMEISNGEFRLVDISQ